jgi:hypothetical protein
MNSKVRIQTNKAKLDVCLRPSLVFWLNRDVSLAGLSWPLYIGGHVSSNRSGSIQTCHIWRFIYQFPYSNNILWLLSWAYVSIGFYPNTPQGYQRHGPR